MHTLQSLQSGRVPGVGPDVGAVRPAGGGAIQIVGVSPGDAPEVTALNLVQVVYLIRGGPGNVVAHVGGHPRVGGDSAQGDVAGGVVIIYGEGRGLGAAEGEVHVAKVRGGSAGRGQVGLVAAVATVQGGQVLSGGRGEEAVPVEFAEEGCFVKSPSAMLR